MTNQRKSYLIITAISIIISLILISLMGCASNVSYKKNCWGEAVSAAIAARHYGYEHRIAWDRDLNHAWAEVRTGGKWYRMWGSGNWFVDISGHDKYTATKYFTLPQALDQTMEWREAFTMRWRE